MQRQSNAAGLSPRAASVTESQIVYPRHALVSSVPLAHPHCSRPRADLRRGRRLCGVGCLHGRLDRAVRDDLPPAPAAGRGSAGAGVARHRHRLPVRPQQAVTDRRKDDRHLSRHDTGRADHRARARQPAEPGCLRARQRARQVAGELSGPGRGTGGAGDRRQGAGAAAAAGRLGAGQHPRRCVRQPAHAERRVSRVPVRCRADADPEGAVRADAGAVRESERRHHQDRRARPPLRTGRGVRADCRYGHRGPPPTARRTSPSCWRRSGSTVWWS